MEVHTNKIKPPTEDDLGDFFEVTRDAFSPVATLHVRGGTYVLDRSELNRWLLRTLVYPDRIARVVDLAWSYPRVVCFFGDGRIETPDPEREDVDLPSAFLDAVLGPAPDPLAPSILSPHRQVGLGTRRI